MDHPKQQIVINMTCAIVCFSIFKKVCNPDLTTSHRHYLAFEFLQNNCYFSGFRRKKHMEENNDTGIQVKIFFFFPLELKYMNLKQNLILLIICRQSHTQFLSMKNTVNKIVILPIRYIQLMSLLLLFFSLSDFLE